MDIHRCRFVPYQPSTINALAFSHTSTPKQNTPKDLRLAIGRENGNLEIWNPNRGQWTQERIFYGSARRTIEQVHWTQDLVVPEEEGTDQQRFGTGPLRLFTTGGSGSITEWDTEKGIPKRHADGNADDIWCFAVQPQWTETQIKANGTQARAAPSPLLAAGCANGTILLFSTLGDELRYERVLAPRHGKKSRCISITWRDRNTVVAGFEESTIRVIDVRNRQIIRTLTLGKARDAAKPLIWTVKCLPNGTILSGDSSGELKIWDATNFSLTQRLKTHQADILDITTNATGTMILTCGVDRRTVAYAQQPGPGNSKTQRWHEIRHRRFHQHDVKVITSYESRSLSIAVSGGIDTVPVVVPFKNWDEEYHRSLPHLPQRPQMSVSSNSRIMLTWWARDLLLWQLPTKYKESTDQESVSEASSNHKLLAQIQLSSEEHITSAEISSNGDLIVAATGAGVKLFQIRRTNSHSDQAETRSRPIELPKMLAGQGASSVGFSPDGKWLYTVRLNSVLVMVKISPASSAKERPVIHERVIKLDRKSRKSSQLQGSALRLYPLQISTVSFASDSRILAVGDISGNIDTWVLEGHETIDSPQLLNGTGPGSDASDNHSDSGSDSDSDDETDTRVIHGQKWIRTTSGSQLPCLESAILTLGFKPSTAAPSLPNGIYGNEGLHATRHNHHPIAPEFPPQEAGMLTAVTANHQIVEFDVINCRLSDWSRRNPSVMLPERFRKIVDRVMGIWFDLRSNAGIERLWLYGSNFIFMLDLNRDLKTTKDNSSLVKIGRLGKHVLEAPQGHVSVKYGHNNEPSKKKRRKNTGAGDEMIDQQKYSSRVKIWTTNDDDGDVNMDAGLPSPPGSVQNDDDEDDEMDEDDNDAVVVKRRKALGPTNDDAEQLQKKYDGPASWHTFQYRGIYGICALHPRSSADEVGEGDTSSAPEVVVVERPMYDVELGSRFSGGQDW